MRTGKWFLVLFLTVTLAVMGTAANLLAYDLYATDSGSDEFYGINSSNASSTWLFHLPEGC